MSNFPLINKNKKTVILAAISLVIILSAIIFSINTYQSKQNTTNITNPQTATNNTNDNANTPIVQTNNTTNSNTLPNKVIKNTQTLPQNRNDNPSQVINEFTIKDWVVSDNDVYTFQYPIDWKLQRTLFAKGQTIALIPQNQAFTPYTPTWSITITKTDTNNPISNNEVFYQNSGFTKGTTTVSGFTGDKQTGKFPPNATESTAVRETNIYLVRSDYSYMVSYKYPGGKLNLQYENLFQKITNTISIAY